MVSCSSVLMQPAEIFWKRFINPQPIFFRQNLVQELALRCLATLGLLFAAPMFFMGLSLKIVSILCSLGQNGPNILPLIEQIQPRAQIPAAVPPSEEMLEAAQSLNQLNQLLADPTWTRYHELPLAQKYLIAGRHTYPTYWGWNFVTRYTLMNAFEEEFRPEADLSGARRGIREAIRLQEKILFVHTLKQILIHRLDLNPLRNQDLETFNQTLYYVAREHHCRREEDAIETGIRMLIRRPNDAANSRALNSMLISLKGAYDPYDLPMMQPEPVHR
jgi:hypothetical protein